MKTDFYQRITKRIVAELEKGVRPWFKPWSAANTEGRITRPLRSNGQPYSGINVLNLWAESVTRGFVSPMWMTFKQAKELGGFVRKGETGSLVVYASTFTKAERDEATGSEAERDIPFLKAYSVFNVDQIEGLPERFAPVATPRLDPVARNAAADAFFARCGADIRSGGNMAFYSQSGDFVQLPPFEAFRDPESYYATLAHEMTHWTKHEKRLDREFGRKRWGDEGYAAEELVAELGAAFLCADLDLTPELREDHAAYIGHWLKVLKGDTRAIFTAAAHAQRAADFIYNAAEVTRRAA